MALDRSDIVVLAVSRGRRECVLEDGAVIPFAALHASDGEEVDEVIESGFATAELSGGGWFAVRFADFPVTHAS